MNKIYTKVWNVLFSSRVVISIEQIRFDQKGQVKNRKKAHLSQTRVLLCPEETSLFPRGGNTKVR